MTRRITTRALRPVRLIGQVLMILVVAVAASVFAAGFASADAPAPDKSTATFEVDFLEDMIDHHAMATEMAELCLQKAVHQELRALCEDIIAMQSQEIAMMQSWLADWYGVSHEPEMKPGEMRKHEKLASLSGAEFESAFMEMMIKHHTRAIKEAEKCLAKADHSALRALCEDIIATQSQEIAMMQSWLCAWYGVCQKE
jgi:uncharacterized protein (DUF305 family)